MTAYNRSLHVLLGDHPGTAPFKQGTVASNHIKFKFADEPVPNKAFKRVVRTHEFDLAELAIVTYLMAKARGAPLTLLPVVLTSRYQHPYLLYNSTKGTLTTNDLNGKRIGIRSWSVTTAVWLKGMLSDDYGVDLDSIQWTTFEDAHISNFSDPAGVQRANPDQSLQQMLQDGDIDAAVIPSMSPCYNFRPVIQNPSDEAIKWHNKYNTIQINHMMVVHSELCKSDPEMIREIYSLLKQSIQASGGTLGTNPCGVESNRRNLQRIIEIANAQKLIPECLEVDDLFDDITREFN